MQKRLTLIFCIPHLLVLLVRCASNEREQKLVSLTPPDSHDYKEHIKFLTQLIEKEPNSDKLYYNRSLANYKAERLRAARRDIEDAIKINRNQPKYHYQKALIESRFNQIQEALNSALTAKDEGFEHPDLTSLLGQLYFKAGNFDQALVYLLQCENNSYYSDSTTLLYLSYIYFQKKDTAEAQKRLEPLLKKYPGTSQAANLLMELSLAKAQSRKAVVIYNKFTQNHEATAEMNTSLALAYLRLKKEDSAYFYFQKAFLQDSTQWRASIALKDKKISEKNLKEAVKYYEVALRHNPNLDKGFYDLGFIYEYYFFEFEKALSNYRKGLRYFPNDKKLLQSISRIEGKIQKGKSFYINPPKNTKDSLLRR